MKYPPKDIILTSVCEDASIMGLLFTNQFLFYRLRKALTKIGNSGPGGCNIWREVQPPADFAINVHGVVHIVARSLLPIDFFHNRPQSGVQQLQAFLSRGGDLRKIPVKLCGAPKLIPSGLTGDW
jgi:hypothetical protein